MRDRVIVILFSTIVLLFWYISIGQAAIVGNSSGISCLPTSSITFTAQVKSAEDDCKVIYDGESFVWQNTSNALTIGYWSPVYYKYGFAVRFSNVTIPQGAHITSAKLELTCNDGTSYSPVNATIYGVKEPDTGVLGTTSASLSEYKRRRGIVVGGANNSYLTTSYVYWDDIEPWVKDNTYNTPDFSPVAQEIVNQSGWVSGNHMAIFVGDHEDRSAHIPEDGSPAGGAYRDAYQYEEVNGNGVAGAARIVITYEIVPVKPTTLESFIIDPKSGLIFNDYLIRLDNIARIVVMNSSTSNIVVIGKDNWLFTDVNESMADYRGLTHLSDSQLSYVLGIVKSERDYLKPQGIPLILVVAPNKESIYPEYMPDNIKKIGNDTQLDQVLRYFKEKSDINIIDLRPNLIAAKSERQVYRKNDSHWNSYGSYIAYRAIIGATGLTAHDLSDYNEVVNVDEKGGSTGDLSRLLKMEDMYPETEVIKRYELKDVPSDRLPSALIFHDSFYSSTNLQTLLAPHFDKVTEVRYGQISLFSSALVEKVKPSVVIYIMVERVLPRYFMPWN